MHFKQSGYGHVPFHNYHRCDICSKNNQGCSVVQATLQEQMDLGWIQDHRIRGINMMQEAPGNVQNFDICTMNVNLVAMHSRLSQQHDLPSQDYSVCSICSKDDQGCVIVQEALQRQIDLGWIHDFCRKDRYQVNMVQIFNIRLMNTSLVGLHAKQVRLGFLASHN